jgi:hypothetical protein
VDVSNKVLNTFALVMNFQNCESFLCHFTISLFEAPNISGKTLIEIMKLLLVEIQLKSKVSDCVKDEGKNLTTLNVALFQVVSCIVL